MPVRVTLDSGPTDQQRTPRRRPATVAVLATVAALGLAGGLVASHLAGTSSSTPRLATTAAPPAAGVVAAVAPSPALSSVTSSTPTPGAAATPGAAGVSSVAPTATQPPAASTSAVVAPTAGTALPISSVLAGARGAHPAANGTPAGFPHTPAGAVGAATAHLMIAAGSAMYAPDSRASGWATISDPAWWATHRTAVDTYYAGQAQQLGLNAPGAAPAGTSLVATVQPDWGAFKVAKYNPTTAWVVIWYFDQTGLSSRTGHMPPPRWQRTELVEHWVAAQHDWKLASIPATTPGPTPTPALAVPTAAARAALLGNTSGWTLYATPSTTN